MLPIGYEKLNPGNFGAHSLDDFIRRQAVRLYLSAHSS